MTTIRVPDIGDASNVTVIEIAVSQGDTVSEGDTLIVLESDKASMEIPADVSGVVGKIHISEGSEVNEGDPICELDGPGSVAEAPKESVPAEPAVAEASGAPQLVSVPDTDRCVLSSAGCGSRSCLCYVAPRLNHHSPTHP